MAAIAALSDSRGDRDVRHRVAGGDDLLGQAGALGADRRSVAARRSGAAQRLARARPTSATRAPGSSPRSPTRASGTAKIAPIDARTALGPKGSAVPGPSATDEAPKASAQRSTVPTLPGSRDAPQVRRTAGRPAAPQRCS